MHSQPSAPQRLQRSYSNKSYTSHGTAATTASSASSRLLFGEITLTPATSIDQDSTRANDPIGSLICSTSSASSRLWLDDTCYYNILDRLQPGDLCGFRLVCRYFASIAASRLFENMAVTFRTSTFSKPARIKALSRIGRHVLSFAFHMPHGSETRLPPVIDAATGTEEPFNYKPRVLASHKAPRYGSWYMQNLLVHQYPPLFHAAANVSAFCAAFSELGNLVHLKVSCPDSSGMAPHPCSIVDYALISLRIAIESAPLHRLSALSLSTICFGGLRWLHPECDLGSTASSAKRWSQIRRLSICMKSIPFSSGSSRIRAAFLDRLHILHAYLSAFQPGLTNLCFRWKGLRGPSPLHLDRKPSTVPVHEQCTQASTLGRPPKLRPLQFPCLHVLKLGNAAIDLAQTDDFFFVNKYALPEFMDVPVMLLATDAEPHIVGPLLEKTGCTGGKVSGEKREPVLPRWLSKYSRTSRKKHETQHSSWIGRTGAGTVERQPRSQEAYA